MTDVHKRVAKEWMRQLEDAAQLVRALPGAGPWMRQVDDLRERLNRDEQLVAVFGAFSAGKSSLINAILGDNALVVSPNPTTASVTHIQGTASPSALSARVIAKTREQLWEDVRLALNHIHRASASLEDAMTVSRTLQMTEFAPSARKYVTFLKAVADGWTEMSDRLGTNWVISIDELRKFTAEERVACYIHRVELTHPASVLANGMTLVDTPGVDSIHRRHTDVAFHYMRNADAVVFVLYYTHAFSRADKDFLAQLSDVQDVVGTNKLFIVINAVDLATSESERSAVRNRVVNELKQLGIRQPRVHEVSSQLSFVASQAAKTPDDARFQGFLRQKLNLTNEQPLPSTHELQEMSGVSLLTMELNAYVQSQAMHLAQSAVHRRLQSIGTDVVSTYRRKLEEADASESARAEWRIAQTTFASELRAEEGLVAAVVAEQQRSLEAEWNELTFHMGERVRLKYAGLFREAFYPGRFGTGNEKVQLQAGAEEFVDMLVRQIDTECRTFALRAHAQGVRAIQRWLAVVRDCLQESHADAVVLPSMESEDIGVSEPDRHADISWQLLRPFFRHFSSTKQFYEGRGQQEMLSASEPALFVSVRSEIDEISAHIRRNTWASVRAVITRVSHDIHSQLVDRVSEENRAPAELMAWQQAADWFGHWFVTSSMSDEPII